MPKPPKPRRKVEPITPHEAGRKEKFIPPFVIQAFNNLIEQDFDGCQAKVEQDKVIKEIMSLANESGEGLGKTPGDKVYDYLNIEGIFRAAGWEVEYHKASYGENDFPTYFIFTVKGS